MKEYFIEDDSKLTIVQDGVIKRYKILKQVQEVTTGKYILRVIDLQDSQTKEIILPIEALQYASKGYVEVIIMDGRQAKKNTYFKI